MNRWMDKDVCVSVCIHTQNAILLHHKEERILLSEISQGKTNTVSYHLCRIWKIQQDYGYNKKETDSGTENKLVVTRRVEGRGRDSSWAAASPKRWCCESAALNMPANLEQSAVATGLEKVSFHSNPKERQCQRMLKLPHNCPHLTR